ncbi:MAG: hypothetical protein JST59_00865 [Actinobacteria bacterium]|nr:hypothetical protein [Actinomycetota bacterium]
MFFNGYLEFKKGRKPQLSNRRSEAGLLRLHLYSEGNSKEDSNSVIYCLEHVSTGGYFGFGDKGVGLYEGKRLLNAMQLRRCVIDNIGITGFMNTLMEVFNFDPLEQSSDFLRSFLIWTKSKVIKQMQTRHYSGEVSDFELLQREFFEFGLVDKLFRIHVLREEAPVRKEVVMLINFLCKDSPTNSAWLLRAHNFILANFY